MARIAVVVLGIVLLLGAGRTPLTVRIVTQDGKPVAGAAVVVVHGGAIGSSGGLSMKAPIAKGMVGPDGRFRVDAAPIDEVFTVIAAAPGFTLAHRCLLYEEGDPVEEVEIVLAAAGKIRGVVAGPDGKPVAGAKVYAIPASGPVSVLRLRPGTARVLVMDSAGDTDFIIADRAVTDSEGRYTISTIPLGRKMAVRAEADGLPPTKWVEPVEVTGEKPAVDLDLRFPPPVRLTVLVRSTEGEPLADARVGLSGLAERPVTDAVGQAVFPAVAPGEWTIRVVRRGWLPTSRSTTIPEDAKTHRAVVVLSAGISAEGTVVDERGEPVRDASVRIWPKKTGSGQRSKTDAEGRFSVRPLREGPHRFQVRRKGHEEVEGRVTLPLGEEPLRVVLHRTGVVRFRTVPAVDEIDVSAESEERSTFEFLDVEREGEVLSVAGVPGGRVRLVLEAEGYAPAIVRTVVPYGGRKDLGEVRFSVGMTLRGRVVTRDGKPIADADVWLGRDDGSSQSAVTDAAGRFALPHLGPGPHEVEIEAEGFLTTETPVEMVKEDKEIEFVLETGGVIRGAVVTADGKPIEGHLGLRILDAKGEDRAEEGYTKEDGTFASRVPPGVYRIEIHDNVDDGKVYAAKDGVTVEWGRDTKVRLMLPE